jgi:glycosyltransferase involved in cell wall biosynthesis
MIKFTIIIPVYNVEKYLKRCINSCISQSYSNIEIICIDDHSSDKSAKILFDFGKKDERIRIFFHKKNKGTYLTRYTGIINASGDYILFLDGDDILKITACEVLSKHIEKTKSDIVQFGYEEIPGNKKIFSPFYTTSKKRIKSYLSKSNRLSPELWTKAYSSPVITKALKHLKKFYAIIAEDLYVSIIITYFSKTFSCLKETLIYYSVYTGISKRTENNLLIYQSWLLSYKNIIKKITGFVKINIPEFSILLPEMELYLLKDFLFCRISDGMPFKLRHQIFSLLPAYFSGKVIDSFYKELIYKYNIYNMYLDLECSIYSRLKKMLKIFLLYIRSFFKAINRD